jgi:hydroxymethylpyrimidine pyrophosphatase-like HAD family hydrolase
MKDIEIKKGEVFLEVKDFNDYMISNYGRVLSLPKKINQKKGSYKYTDRKILNPSVNEKGYHHIRLYKNGKQYTFRVHRLVYSTFVNKIPNGYEINHLDCDKSNNSISNLEICTRQENMNHAVKEGRIKGKKGSSNHFSKFTSSQVKLIRHEYSKGISIRELSENYNVNWCTIQRIVKNKTYVI